MWIPYVPVYPYFSSRIDYGMSSTERLYEYISARTYGEHHGDCAAAYPQCPFSVFSFLDPSEVEALLGNAIP